MQIVSCLERYIVSVCAAALMLAGCSTMSPFQTSVPGSSAEITALQASGELPAPVPRQVLQRQLQQIQGKPRPRRLHVDGGKVALWASYAFYSDLLGLNKKVDKVLVDVDTSASNCFTPVTVKVDHKQNVWIACEELNPHYPANFGGEQEYSSSGTVEQSYAFDASRYCVSGYRFCAAESLDGGPDNRGHVFAELSGGDSVVGSGTPHFMNPGFYWWDANDPSGPGTFIRASRYCKPLCAIYYMDTDNSGNIWFDFATGDNGSGAGLGEITNPTSSPSVKIVLPAGTYQYPAGVYVSKHGAVLNVTDQGTRYTYQYRLPVKPTSTPFNVLGPAIGLPIAGGFNKTESALALGDYASGINIGKLPANRWSTKGCGLKSNESPCWGVAYTPSGK